MYYLKKSFIIFIICFVSFSCATTQRVQVEYPVFLNSKEGRELRKFLGNMKIVAIKIEKSQGASFDSSVSSFLDRIPNMVFAEFSKESYFKLIDVNKRADLINETSFSLTGATQNKLRIGKQLGAEGFLYVSFGAIDRLITLDASLVKVETGELRKKTIMQNFSSVNDFEVSIKEATRKISLALSPRVKTVSIKTFAKYPQDLDIEELLQEAQEEIKGETPNYKKAFSLWEKADRKAKSKSWEVLTNLGTYYYSQGDFENAVKYYERAMKVKSIKSKDKSYVRSLRKKAESSLEEN